MVKKKFLRLESMESTKYTQQKHDKMNSYLFASVYTICKNICLPPPPPPQEKKTLDGQKILLQVISRSNQLISKFQSIGEGAALINHIENQFGKLRSSGVSRVLRLVLQLKRLAFCPVPDYYDF